MNSETDVCVSMEENNRAVLFDCRFGVCGLVLKTLN